MLESFSNPLAVYVGLPVLYYPTKEEATSCGRKTEVPALIYYLRPFGLVDIKVTCPFGFDYTKKRVPKKTEEGEVGCWDYTEQYKKVYRGLN